MKGVIFREFLDLVEDTQGLETVDRIITESDLASRGSYAATGAYDHGEILRMAGQLSELTGIPVGDLVRGFGKHLFERLTDRLSRSLSIRPTNLFDLLEAVDGTIHADVRKIYPDADLPRFETSRPADGVLRLAYRSARPFADLAEGLIEGAAEHFGVPVQITREDLPPGDGTAADFTVSVLAP